jgi:glucose-6-phosphate isomerase
MQSVFEEHHEEGEQKHEDAVTGITEHDSEQEGECDNREDSWVDFPVAGDTVSIDNSLETAEKFVCSVVSWWLLLSFHAVQD